MKRLEGQIFGRLTVLLLTTKNKHGQMMWTCQCSCGNVVDVSTNKLTSGWTKSCGCLQKEVSSERIKQYNKVKVDNMNYSAGFNKVYYRYKRSASIRGYEFCLSENEFECLCNQPCYYCGAVSSGIDGHFKYNGVDRVDNNLGYFIENVVSCCKHCNVAKHNMSQAEFYELIAKIYKNRIEVNE